MKENIIKIIISAGFAGLSAYLNALALPVIILIVVMVCDYISGMIKAWITKELSSRTGIIGIVKKLCYFLVVCVGMCIDWILQAGLSSVGIEYTNSFLVGLIVSVWLIINELISILENLSIIGIPMPEFLLKLTAKLKITVENKTNTEE